VSKKKALFVFTVFDLFALLALWLGYNEINKVITGVANFADTVSLNNRIGFFSFGIGIPIGHVLLICDYLFLHRVFAKKPAWGNGAYIIFGVVLFASAIFISAYMRTYVERAGYLHCPKADDRMTFTTYLMYTKNYDICSQLAAEKKKQ
jgi:hypothetical protein